MSLGNKQETFARLVPRLIDKAHELGFAVRIGDVFRDPRVFGAPGHSLNGAYGHPNSAHKQKLAIDLNLFKDGVFLSQTSDHKPLGEWWEKQHPDARWGGRFKDGNHYSFEHEGIK